MIDLIGARDVDTVWQLFCERARRTPDGLAYCDYDPNAKVWRNYTWSAIAARIDRFRSALAREALKPGDRVGLLLPNSVDWVCFDMAAQASGLVVVGLYPHDSIANNAYILGHSGARLILLDMPERSAALSAHLAELPALDRIWIRDGVAGSADDSGRPATRRLIDILAEGSAPPIAWSAPPDSLATLIYTSGTTGRPKGVMLSHRALLLNAEAVATIIPPETNDVFLSILPLAHAFERTVGYYLPMMAGSAIAYSRSPQLLAEDLLALRPTVMLGVPRLYERIYAAIRARVEGNTIKRFLLQHAASLGWRHHEAVQHRRPPLGFMDRLSWLVLERLVARRAMAAFGGRLRVAVSGGAALDEQTARQLIGLGLPLVEGYGLTEAGPVVTANHLDDNLPGSVGWPLQGVELRLGEQGELQVRTPSVMLGYWNDDAQTKQALRQDGWLVTGDIAEIRDGRVYIRGRLKDIIALSTGEKVDPNVVEAELLCSPLFKQLIVLGERRPFLSALIVLDEATWQRSAQDWSVPPDNPNAGAAKAKILAEINIRLHKLPHYAQVRAAHLGLEPWTIDAGFLTPTLKVKREMLQNHFAKEIEELYATEQNRQQVSYQSS
jgi:long-chain acyl-CoA synthetase